MGSRIPTEPALCELTGTARNTVREAVQALVHAGMLERRQGSGTYVMSASDHWLADYFAVARAADLLELREVLAITTAGLAAERRTDADIASLTRLLELRNRLRAQEHVPAAFADRVAADVAIQRAIVAASCNAVYLDFYDCLQPLLDSDIRALGPSNSYEADHAELVGAVIAGDAPSARAAAQRLLSGLRAQ